MAEPTWIRHSRRQKRSVSLTEFYVGLREAWVVGIKSLSSTDSISGGWKKVSACCLEAFDTASEQGNVKQQELGEEAKDFRTMSGPVQRSFGWPRETQEPDGAWKKLFSELSLSGGPTQALERGVWGILHQRSPYITGFLKSGLSCSPAEVQVFKGAEWIKP